MNRGKIWLEERMEKVTESKYLETILYKHGSMGRETGERTVQGRQVIGALEL